jgi:hypothetical protein
MSTTITTPTLAPKHKHDCCACTFIGCAGDSDLYVCDGTLVVREGSEPENNRTISGYLIEALIRRGESVEGFLNNHYGETMKACYLIAKLNGLVN